MGYGHGSIGLTACKGQGATTVDAGRGGRANQGRPVACGLSALPALQGVYEGGCLQKQLTRMSGLAVATFCHDGTAALRQAICDDEHTLVCYQADNRLIIIYRYELDRGYDIGQQRSFYKKAFL